MKDPLDRIAHLWAEGVKIKEISARLGVSKGVVCGLTYRARRNGDPRFPARGFVRTTTMPEIRPPPLITELKPNQCRFPVTPHETARDEHRFCAKPQKPGSSYCPEHDTRCVHPLRGAGALTSWVKT